MAFVGGVSLAGVVVNDAIMLMDFTNHLRRREEVSIKDAVVQAGQTHFVPVILTTVVTTIGGLLTLRGGTLWAPMGWTIIGGLALATVLTLVIVPVLYSLITRE